MSEIQSSAGLLAQNSYQKIQSRANNIAHHNPLSINDAKDFQQAVKVAFNKFATMSPDQILAQIKGANRVSSVNNSGNLFGDLTQQVKSVVQKHESTVRRSLIGQASSLELLTNSTEASNTVKSLVTVRDKMLEAYEKMWGMSI
jgi:flagellar hook-basal body complex protein FliE